MKSETVKIFSAYADSKKEKTSFFSCMPPTLKNEFGGQMVCGSADFEETYLFIEKDLIIKSIKIIS